jgi:uncharacterized protein (TIGR00375 family)
MVDADFHIHGKHSGGVSPDMEIPVIAEEAEKKGLDLVGMGDILNPKWMKHVEETTERKGGGVRTHGSTDLMLTTEVEDNNRVHHIIIFPSLSSVKNAYEDFKKHSSDIRTEGRPRIDREGEKIVEIAKKHDALIGPAHAFTPYTAVYGKHDSLKECYGVQEDNIDFLELGLSADSMMASRISDHDDLVFMSNSDAHSPWPHRLGREFNRFEMEQTTFGALERRLDTGNKFNLNVGLDPKEGKYHCTACNSCYQKYSMEQAEKFDWKCQECDGRIKKGVKDRVEQLADREPQDHDYLHLPPLANIIQEVVGHSSPTTKTVQRIWKEFNQEHGSEIDILVEKPVEELSRTNRKVADAIEKFRNGHTVMVPGGGGSYGELIIPSDQDEKERIEEKRKEELECRYSSNQTTL